MVVGVGLVTVGLGAWWLSLGDDEPVTDRSPRGPSVETTDAADAAVLSDGDKPTCEACIDGGTLRDPTALAQRTTPPWMASQEPPPDTLGPPGDAGLPPLPPPPLPDDIEVTTPDALRARQEETIRTIEARLVQVERALERAEQSGDPGISVIQHRRDQLVSRRDRLREVIATGETEIHVPSSP